MCDSENFAVYYIRRLFYFIFKLLFYSFSHAEEHAGS